MSRHVFFWLLAATAALIATQATAQPAHPPGHSGAKSSHKHGFHGGAKRRHHAGTVGFGWPAVAWPDGVSGPSSVVVVPGADIERDREQFRCEYIDCTFSYHPFGFYDPRSSAEKFAPVYMIAPNVKIISID